MYPTLGYCIPPSSFPRPFALQALGELHPHFLVREPTLTVVNAALDDAEWEVRTQAVKVLGSLDSRNFRCYAQSRLEAIARGRTSEASGAVRGAASEAILIQSQRFRQGVRPGPEEAKEPSWYLPFGQGTPPGPADLPFDSRSMAVMLRSLWPRGFEEWGFLFVCLYAAACFWCPDAVIETFALLTFAA